MYRHRLITIIALFVTSTAWAQNWITSADVDALIADRNHSAYSIYRDEAVCVALDVNGCFEVTNTNVYLSKKQGSVLVPDPIKEAEKAVEDQAKADAKTAKDAEQAAAKATLQDLNKVSDPDVRKAIEAIAVLLGV